MSDAIETSTIAPIATIPVAPVAVEAPVKTAKAAAKAAKADVVDALRSVLAPKTEKAKRRERIAEAEAKGANDVLKAAGVKKSERARMLEELKAGRVELSTVKQQAAEAAKKVEAVTAEAAALTPYVERMKKYADAEFDALPEAWQKTLADMKLEDPMKRLDMIDVWKKHGVLTAAAAVAAPKAPNPSKTMADANPAAQKSGATLNHYEQWKALKDAGHRLEASAFYSQHGRKIDEQSPSK